MIKPFKQDKCRTKTIEIIRQVKMTELELESTSMSENWEEWCCRTDNKYNSIYIVRHFPNWIMFPSQEDKKANRNS